MLKRSVISILKILEKKKIEHKAIILKNIILKKKIYCAIKFVKKI